MSIIPGLSFVPADEEKGELISLQAFNLSFSIPESYRYGNCRPRTCLEKLGTISEGNFATIYKCRNERDGQIYALKKFILTPVALKDGVPLSFLREINLLKLLKHENIVNSHEVLAGKNLNSNFLLLDYCVTSLHELMEKGCNIYERDIVKYIMRQLFDGISYLHESTVVHGNISCRNLLFTECGTLKISGFRTSQFYHEGSLKMPEETELIFRAPELLFEAEYGLPIDLWSAGCVLAYLLLKRPLFFGSSRIKVLESIFKALGTPSEKIWPGYDEIFKKGFPGRTLSMQIPYSRMKNILVGVPNYSSELLQDLLIYNPPHRIGAAAVLRSSYILDTPPECTSEKMISILIISNLVDKPMNVDR